MTDSSTHHWTHVSDDGTERRNVLKAVTAAGLGSLGLSTGSAAAHPKPNIIAVRAVEVPVRYEIVVSGEIAKGPKAGGTDRIVDSNVARGFIDTVGEVDNFRFSGQITAFNADVADALEVFVNGTLVEDPVGLPEEAEPEPALENTITIQAQNAAARYQFSVTGQVRKGPQADAQDRTQGRTVEGVVGGTGVDDFQYSGAIKFVSSDAPLRVVLNLNQN